MGQTISQFFCLIGRASRLVLSYHILTALSISLHSWEISQKRTSRGKMTRRISTEVPMATFVILTAVVAVIAEASSCENQLKTHVDAILPNIELDDTCEARKTSGACEVPPDVAKFHAAAKADLTKYRQFKSLFEEAAERTGIPSYLLAAIASRESNIGRALPVSGYGHDGHGYGIMQVDDRYHKVDKSKGPHSLENIIQGANILKDMIIRMELKFPSWTPEQRLRGAVAAYNFDVKNVRTVDGIDRGTAHHNYSKDVITRAQYFRKNE